MKIINAFGGDAARQHAESYAAEHGGRALSLDEAFEKYGHSTLRKQCGMGGNGFLTYADGVYYVGNGNVPCDYLVVEA